jgi:hypothetical protein
MPGEDFDQALLRCASIIDGVLREVAWKSWVTSAYFLYPDRLEIKGLVSEGGADVCSFEAIYEFGKALAVQGTAIPPALFVAAEAVTEKDGAPCIFISGCTPDGRRNSMQILLERSRWRKILRPGAKILHPHAPEVTSAVELMRGLSEGSAKPGSSGGLS